MAGRDVFARFRFRRVVVSCLLCLGFWQFGHGAYIPAKAWVAQELMQRAWRRAENGNERPAPWPWADTWPVAKLSAKGGDIELIVLAGGSGRTLAFGPGHLSASALPGEYGNSVIAGHRDTHFQFLQLLKVGESLLFEMPDGRNHLYRINSLDVVDSRRGSIVLDTDQAMLSLVTCYPFNAVSAGTPMRYVVSAELIY
jgi:sortase A